MSKDLYKSRRMYQNPIVLIIAVVCAMILAIFVIDIVSKKVSIAKIDNDTKTVLKDIMEVEAEKRKEVAEEKLKKLGNNSPSINIIENGDVLVLINNSSYFTIVGELFKKPKYYTASFKASYNDYHEIVVEKYDDGVNGSKNDDIIIK